MSTRRRLRFDAPFSLTGTGLYLMAVLFNPMLLLVPLDLTACAAPQCQSVWLITPYAVGAVMAPILLGLATRGSPVRGVLVWILVAMVVAALTPAFGPRPAAPIMRLTSGEVFDQLVTLLAWPGLISLLALRQPAHIPTPQQPQPPLIPVFRSFRWQGMGWGVMLLAGPLNPAAWWLGRPQPENVVLNIWPYTIGLAVLPATCLGIVALWPLIRQTQFTTNDIVGHVAKGWAVAILISPVLFWVGGLINGENVGPGAILGVAALGWFFGIIPYFAVVLGLPVAATAAALIWLASRPLPNAKGPPVGDPFKSVPRIALSDAGPDA